jgi:hypothetical protein
VFLITRHDTSRHVTTRHEQMVAVPCVCEVCKRLITSRLQHYTVDGNDVCDRCIERVEFNTSRVCDGMLRSGVPCKCPARHREGNVYICGRHHKRVTYRPLLIRPPVPELRTIKAKFQSKECPVCYEGFRLYFKVDCGHKICMRCTKNMGDAGMHTCPMCRDACFGMSSRFLKFVGLKMERNPNWKFHEGVQRELGLGLGLLHEVEEH